MIPTKGKEPGAFIITRKKDGTQFVMSEATLTKIVNTIGEASFDKLFEAEWAALTEEEKRLAQQTVNQAIKLQIVTCHDHTPFRDYQCSECGYIMHVHKSQLPPNYQDIELRTFCKKCGAELVLPQPRWIGD